MTATGYRRTHSWLLHLQCRYHGIYTQQQWLYIIPWICAPSMLSSATKSDRYLYSKSLVVLVIQWITHFFHRNEDVFLSHKNLPFDYHAAIKVCWHGNHNSPGWCFTFVVLLLSRYWGARYLSNVWLQRSRLNERLWFSTPQSAWNQNPPTLSKRWRRSSLFG